MLQVVGELEELGRKYPFQIPPFFALVIRAFSVIEGSALRVDPDYAIVKECFPYLARRWVVAPSCDQACDHMLSCDHMLL